MRSIAWLIVLSIILAVVALADDTPQVTSEVRPEQVLPADILTNEGVVLLCNSGFSDAFIAEKIQLSRARLDTTVDGLTYLRRNSVSEELIRYIMERVAQPHILPASAPSPAPAPAPILVPLKLVRKKVLVPQPVIAIPVSSGAVGVGMPIPIYSKKASYYGWYVPPAASSSGWDYSQPAYGLTASAAMQSLQ